MVEVFASLTDAVARVRLRIKGALRVAAPLGLGKPHRLLNALYDAAESNAARPLHLFTALSLDPPRASGELEQRFLEPFVARHFGPEFPRLAYVEAMRRDELPAHITVEEFYVQAGSMLGSSQAQRNHSSLNYTHVARALADRGVNCVVQKVAMAADGTRLSLSSNTDVTMDAVEAIMERGLARPLLVAEVDPELPWLGGTAVVDLGWFDIVVAPQGPYPPLFGVPRQPVDEVDHAIGLYASALVRDGGTLQIGIGALADALAHALTLRHTDNAAYRRALERLAPGIEEHPMVVAYGGLEPFSQGLFGCSEMIGDGFKCLVEAGVIRRKVVDDAAVMRRVIDGVADAADLELIASCGELLHGAFYLGSSAFYAWLRGLDEATRRAVGMRRVSEVNALGEGAIGRLQRTDARFFNTCMMATGLGAAVSDGLADGRVVSGVGGQYNFVAMAHELRGARSVLMLRATHKEQSNIRWNYPHTTIPRHLRDVFVTEYGIADVRGKTDEECVVAMAGICDERARGGLMEEARQAGKLSEKRRVAEGGSREQLREALAPVRADGTLPDYPLGSDFTPVEQRLVRALAWLKQQTETTGGKLRTMAAAYVAGGAIDEEGLRRMGLDAPSGPQEVMSARLVALALARTAGGAARVDVADRRG